MITILIETDYYFASYKQAEKHSQKWILIIIHDW